MSDLCTLYSVHFFPGWLAFEAIVFSFVCSFKFIYNETCFRFPRHPHNFLSVYAQPLNHCSTQIRKSFYFAFAKNVYTIYPWHDMGDIADTAQTVTIYWIFDIFFLSFSCTRVDCVVVGAVTGSFSPQSVSIFLRPIFMYLLSFLFRFTNFVGFFPYRSLNECSFLGGEKLVHLTFFSCVFFAIVVGVTERQRLRTMSPIFGSDTKCNSFVSY